MERHGCPTLHSLPPRLSWIGISTKLCPTISWGNVIGGRPNLLPSSLRRSPYCLNQHQVQCHLILLQSVHCHHRAMAHVWEQSRQQRRSSTAREGRKCSCPAAPSWSWWANVTFLKSVVDGCLCVIRSHPPADSRLDSIPMERTQRPNTETFLECKPLQCSTVMNEWGQKLENKLQKCVFSKHHIFSVFLWQWTFKMRPLPFLHLLQLQLQKNSVGVKTIFISIPNRLNTFNYNPTYILLLALFRGCFRKHWWNLTLSFGWTQFQFPFPPVV